MSCPTGLASLFCCPCAFLGFMMRFVSSVLCCSPPSGRVVGIFSRSDPGDYSWLTRALQSSMFNNLVRESRSVSISNSGHQAFREAVQECNFTILYHTKNRGRINITNVTDSLYDDELAYMSTYRGRVNVIVLVDDLESDDYEVKHRIMEFQPDIVTYSQDLILVTDNDKRHPQLLDRKLQNIADLISGGSWAPVNVCKYLESMTIWVYNNVAAMVFRGRRRRRRRTGQEMLEEPLLV